MFELTLKDGTYLLSYLFESEDGLETSVPLDKEASLTLCSHLLYLHDRSLANFLIKTPNCFDAHALHVLDLESHGGSSPGWLNWEYDSPYSLEKHFNGVNSIVSLKEKLDKFYEITNPLPLLPGEGEVSRMLSPSKLLTSLILCHRHELNLIFKGM